MSDSEKILIERTKKGDIESFEKLIEKYQVTAFNVAYRMIGNKEDASDITQEALIKVFKSIRKFRGESGFSTWFFRIVTNTCIDMVRKESKITTYSIDKTIETEDGSYKREISDEKNIPEQMYEKKEQKERVQKAIGKLPGKYRIAIILRDIQDFSYEEISEILDCPLGTVKSRINRGRALLKEILQKDMELFLED
ncbi:MAG: hypothetical protein PWQ37_734 [Candidatus Petromonas sp.]|nr:hypothetical protein [Candidatus Petromonas sp.]